MRSIHLVAAICGILAAHLVQGCRHPAPPLPDGVDCNAACARLSALECEGGKPSPAGTPCTTFLCTLPISSAHAACISHADTCATAEACR